MSDAHEAALPYDTLPVPPAAWSAGGVLARLVDGLAFRYRWATEDLTDADLAERPCESSMTLGGLLEHVDQLVHWVDAAVAGSDERVSKGAGRVEATLHAPVDRVREATLGCLSRLRGRLVDMGDDDLADLRLVGSRRSDPLSFWYAINGPLSDALTHVGQVNAWRRIAGRPATPADVFRGRPPRD